MFNNKEKLFIKINEKYFSAFWIVVQAIVLMIIGILIFNLYNLPGRFLMIITLAISSFFVIIGVSGVFEKVFSNNEKIRIISLFSSIFNIGISILFISKPDILLTIFPILFTAYIFIDSIFKTITCLIYFENRLENRYVLALRTLLTYTFLIILVLFPMFRLKVTYIIISAYFILLGSTYFLDALELLLPTKNKNKIKRRIRIGLPVFIAAFIPKWILKQINKMFEITEEYDRYIIKKESMFPNIELLIHIKEGKIESFGHVDIFIDNKVISYGPYDDTSNKLLRSISDGVLLELDKDKYINFCNKIEHQNVISFGLKLTDIQKQKIREKLNKIMKDTYVWDPPINQFKDVDYNASKIFKATGAKFYKFKRGKFKTFFVFYTNCVKLADELIGMSGLDILSINGLITPGTYYNYFNKEFRRKNSIVVSKEIYLNKRKFLVKAKEKH